MSLITSPEPGISIPGTSSHFLDPTGSRDQGQGRLRYLAGGSGAPLVLLHTVRTQAEHYRHVIPLVQQHYTVYALDLPGMGYSQIVPGASYDEPAMRGAVERLLTQLDLRDVTLLGGSMGAVLALTAAADLPDRVRRVVAVNAGSRPRRVPQPAQPHRGPHLLRRGHRTDPPHLRGQGLVPPVRPAGQQATAPQRPIHPGAERQPLHRPGTT